MNMEITKEEYRNLLDLLLIAHGVLHAYEAEDNPVAERYEQTIQKIHFFAAAMGFQDLIQLDPDAGGYYPAPKFEETSEAGEVLDAFVDASFWDELIRRFSERDVARGLGGYELLGGLSMTERFALEAPVRSKYSEEFDQHGIERLEIVEHPQTFAMPVKTSD